jgi:uncharacterized protein YjdB
VGGGIKLISVSSVSLNKTALTMVAGTQERLAHTVWPSEATNQAVAWSRDNENVAAVSDSGLVTAVGEGTTVITVRTEDGDKTAQCTVTVTGTPVTGMSLNKTATTLHAGDQEQLMAIILPANATNKVVIWQSSNDAVATVSDNGLVTGVAQGAAEITATTQDGLKTANCAITVTPALIAVTDISLNKTATAVAIGGQEQLTATIQPADADNKTVMWYSSDTDVATVTNSGLVTGVALGTAAITVETQDGNKTAGCAVTVTEIAVTGVSLDKTALTLYVGDEDQLTATVQPANAANQAVTWQSSNNAIATVDTTGLVTSLSIGTATITVRTQDGGKTAQCAVTVAEIPVASVSLNKTATSIEIGGQEQLTATVLPSNASNTVVSWSSSNTAVATVTATGLVSTVSVGTATITVTTFNGNKTATCAVTVLPIAVTSVSLNKTAMSLVIGNQEQLTATVQPANATDKTIAWSSSNTAVATAAAGLVKTVGVGAAEITVTTESGGKTAKCAVTVLPIAVTGVTLNKAAASLVVGNQEQLAATVQPSNATDKVVTWTSSNTAVATVTASGLVKAVGAGAAEITVTTQDGGKTAKCAATVTAIAVTGVTLDRSAIALAVGGNRQLTATVQPSNATYKTVAWQSSNGAIATVSADGLVTGLALGKADITATTQDGNKTAMCAVSVVEAVMGTIAAGYNHSLALKSDNNLWAWGNNEYGQAGDNAPTNLAAPAMAMDGANEWALMSGGESHTMAIRHDGSLWAWGSNSSGQLGDGTNTHRAAPGQVGTDNDWVFASTGARHTHAIKADGSLWGWGYSNGGEVGNGVTGRSQYTPVRVGTDNDWATVSGGESHTMAIKADGSLWGWGWNIDGQLGSGTTNRSTPYRVGTDNDWVAVSTGYSHTMAIKADGSLWAWGWNYYGQLGVGNATNASSPKRVGTANDWAAVSPGDRHTLAVKTDGSLWSWGSNKYGQLGDGTLSDTVIYQTSPKRIGTASDWAAVSGGEYHSVAVKADGSVWTWGRNNYGQLGDGALADRGTPAQVCSLNVPLVPVGGVGLNKSAATLVLGNQEQLTATVQPSNATNKTVIWTSSDNAVATVSRGMVTGVGVGTASITATTKDGGKTAACAVSVVPIPVAGVSLNKAATSLMMGTQEQLTATVQPSNAANQAVTWQSSNGAVASVSAAGLVSGVAVGTAEITVTTQDGNKTAKCAVTVTPIAVTGVGLKSATAMNIGGSEQLAAIIQPSDAANQAVAWQSSNGAVASVSATGLVAGLAGGTAEITVTTQDGGKTAKCTVSVIPGAFTTVAASIHHTMAIAADGSLWGWGRNSEGQRGDGVSTGTKSAPIQVGTDKNWKDVSVGYYHSIALKTDGSLWGWGSNSDGCVGDGTNTNRNTPVRIGTATDWAAISAASGFSIALKADGSIWAWGNNSIGQLGDGTKTNRNAPVRVGADTDWEAIFAGHTHSLAIKTDGSLWAWGWNNEGQLGDNGLNANKDAPTMVGTATDWKAASGGYDHTLAVKTDGTLWRWGGNYYGQQGDGNGFHWSRRSPIQLGTDTDWKAVAAGWSASMALKADGTLWVWGRNEDGELGDGANANRDAPAQVGAAEWASITAGHYQSLAFKANGTLWAWGRNTYGQLGDGTYLNRNIPVPVGANIVGVTGLSLNKTELTLKLGEQEQIVATVQPGNATNQRILWATGGIISPIASVSSSGLVTAGSQAGTVNITARTEDGGYLATLRLTVEEP